MLSLDHLGLATDDAATLSALLEKLVGGQRFASETVAEQGVTAHFRPAAPPASPSPTLELLEPSDTDSPVGRFLEKRGPGMHHLALRVPDVTAAMQHAADLGLRLLSDTPRSGARGKRIAFLHPKDTGGVLIELCEHTDPLPTPEQVPFEHDGASGTLSVYMLGANQNPPLLLLHGAGGCTALETRRLAHRLAPYNRILALDFPGHGASDAFAKAEFSTDLFAESARAVLDHFGFARADVFGFSMGGSMALHLAHEHPGRVRHLAVHGACTAWSEPLAEKMTARLDTEVVQERNGTAAEALKRAHGDWKRLFARATRFVRGLPSRSEAFRALAASIEHPTLVSTADEDDLFPLRAPLALHRALPNARLAVVPGRRHALAQTDLDALLPPLAKHLHGNQD